MQYGDQGLSYPVHADSGEETIADKDVTVSGTEIDVVSFLDGITANQLWFYLDDTDLDGGVDDLVIKRIGTANLVMIENWSDTANQMESITTQSGNCTALNYSVISSLLSIMPPKATPPAVDFLDSALEPYWSGTGC